MSESMHHDAGTILIEIRDVLHAYLADAMMADLQLVSQQPYYKRSYYRNIFSYFEGTIFLMKRACLTRSETLPLEDGVILNEITFELTGNGKPVVKPKYFPLASNIKYIIRIFNTVFDSDVRFSNPKGFFSDLHATVDVRNRITHPKQISDLEVTDVDIERLRRVVEQFNDFTMDLVLAIIKAYTGKVFDKDTLMG